MTFNRKLARELVAQLRADQRALRQGKLSSMTAQPSRRDELVDAFGDMLASCDPGTVGADDRDLVMQAERLSRENAQLFEAAIAGVGRVLHAIQNGGADVSVGAYDARGRPTSFRRATGGFAKNA